MAEFPHLVQMHKNLSKDGLAAVSVNLDAPDDGVEKKVLDFLRQRFHADFTNLMLAKGQDVDNWLEKDLKADALPVQQVYDRNGKLVKTFTGGEHYPEIDKMVDNLLKQK
ncbi:MAG TPA: hypothetical protein VFA18_16420 [Gemmataceae bacterium]|nr:hypothetical protein [Gemmataceae bacterium]